MSLETTGLGLAALRFINAGLGFLLSIALALVFGANRSVDTLFVAMAVAVFLARDLSRVIRAAVVPCLVEATERGDSPEFTSSFRSAVLLIAAGAAALIWVGAPWIVKATTPGFDRAAARETERLLRLLSPSLPLFVLFGSAQGLFHAQRRFMVPELAETLWRLIAIVSLFILGRRWGMPAYATGLAIASFGQWALLLGIGAYAGIRILPSTWQRPNWRLLRPFWLGAVVVLCSVIQRQMEEALDRAVLSFMEPGSIALFSYAGRFAHSVPLLLSTSLLVPWLPEMARVRARIGSPRQLTKQGALFLGALGALLTAVILWAARDVVEFFLLRGEFDPASAELVVIAVRLLALGVPAIFAAQCLAGLYIVERDLKAMVRTGLVAVFVHAVGNLALRRWGIAGIALSGSFTIWIVAGFLWWRIPCQGGTGFIWARFAGAMAAVVILLWGMPWTAVLSWAPARMTAAALTSWALYTAIMWPAIRRMRAAARHATRPAD